MNRTDTPEQSSEAVQEDAAGHDLIVVGASSGGIDALKLIVSGLPANLPAAVLVVVHISPNSPRLLADIINRAGPLPCQYAQDQDVIRRGHIYLAPPNEHLMVEPAACVSCGAPGRIGHGQPSIPSFARRRWRMGRER